MQFLNTLKTLAGLACGIALVDSYGFVKSLNLIKNFEDIWKTSIAVIVSLISVCILLYLILRFIHLLARKFPIFRKHYPLEKFAGYWFGYTAGTDRPKSFCEIYYLAKEDRYCYRGKAYHDDFLTADLTNTAVIQSLKSDRKFASWGDVRSYLFPTGNNEAIFHSDARVYQIKGRPDNIKNYGTLELVEDDNKLNAYVADLGEIGDEPGRFTSIYTRVKKDEIKKKIAKEFSCSDEDIIKYFNSR